jgi:tetratricopeptide (TPR) repeat protein
MRDSETAIEEAVGLTIAAHAALERGDPAAARADAHAAAATLGRHLGADSPDLANVLVLRARAESAVGEWAAAERCAGEAVAIMAGWPVAAQRELDRVRVQAGLALGTVMLARGDYAGAGCTLRATLADARATVGAADPDTGGVLNALGLVARYTGAFDVAADCYARALEIVEDTLGPTHVQAASLHHNLGGLAHARGDAAAGEWHARRAIELRAAALGPEHPEVAADKGAWAAILQRLGRLDEAERLLRETIETFVRAFGADHLEVGIACTSLGAVLHQAGRLQEAEEQYRAGLAIREQRTGAEHPELAATLINLGSLLAQRGQRDQARALYRRALGLLNASVDNAHPTRLAGEQVLAELDRQCTAVR